MTLHASARSTRLDSGAGRRRRTGVTRPGGLRARSRRANLGHSAAAAAALAALGRPDPGRRCWPSGDGDITVSPPSAPASGEQQTAAQAPGGKRGDQRRQGAGRRRNDRHRRHPRHPQRARHGDAARDRDGADPDQRPAQRSASPKARWSRRATFWRRSTRVPTDAQGAIRGPAGARSGLLAQAQSDDVRYQTLVQQNSIAAAGRRIRSTSSSNIKARSLRSGADRRPEAQHRLLPHRLAGQRPRRPAAGRSGQLRADRRATGLAVVTQLQPISRHVLAAGRRNCRRSCRRSRRRKLAPSPTTAPMSSSSRPARSRLDNQIDTTTGTVKMRAKFDNPDEALFPNQFVNVRLLVDTLHGVVAVPSAAIQRGAPGTYVYVVADDTVSVRDGEARPDRRRQGPDPLRPAAGDPS